jgi:hypothetical protein
VLLAIFPSRFFNCAFCRTDGALLQADGRSARLATALYSSCKFVSPAGVLYFLTTFKIHGRSSVGRRGVGSAIPRVPVNQVEHPGDETLSTQLMDEGHHHVANDVDPDEIGREHVNVFDAIDNW